MKINGYLTPVYFDIETTGFSAWEDDFVCWALACTGYNSFVDAELGTIDINLHSTDRVGNEQIVVTWNGENYRGGFDFPWLRSKCIQEGIEWKLAGVKHLDLLPLVRKYINTTHYVTEIPSKSSLRAGDLKKLAKANNFDYQNKNQAYRKMETKNIGSKKGLDSVDWLDYIEPEAKEDNSLQAVYQMMFDPEKEEEYIEGSKIPELYEKIQELEKYEAAPDLSMYNKEEARELWQEIKDHNRRDVERLKKIAEKIIPVIPDWEIERNINEL